MDSKAEFVTQIGLSWAIVLLCEEDGCEAWVIRAGGFFGDKKSLSLLVSFEDRSAILCAAEVGKSPGG